MSHGGKRERAGRKSGAATERTREIADAAAEAGVTPLEYMLKIMRDPLSDMGRRDDMAKAAAQYVHPRLAATQVKSETTVRYVAEVPPVMASSEEWEKHFAPKTIQ
jgi:hypothetical protein